MERLTDEEYANKDLKHLAFVLWWIQERKINPKDQIITTNEIAFASETITRLINMVQPYKRICLTIGSVAISGENFEINTKRQDDAQTSLNPGDFLRLDRAGYFSPITKRPSDRGLLVGTERLMIDMALVAEIIHDNGSLSSVATSRLRTMDRVVN